MTDNPDDLPPDIIEVMRSVSQALTQIFPGAGFVLMVFGTGEQVGKGNYICNVDEAMLITVLKDFIARKEHRDFLTIGTMQ